MIFVAGFQYKSEAERYYKELKERMEKFGLELESSKSRLIEFGRFAEQNRRARGECKPETFDFLGFTFYCSKTRKGGFVPKVQTSRKKFEQKVRAYTWNGFVEMLKYYPLAKPKTYYYLY